MRRSTPTDPVPSSLPGLSACRTIAIRHRLAAVLLAVSAANGLHAGSPAGLAMHWPMEPWTSDDVGELESGTGPSGSLVGFPGDGSEWTVGVLGRALVLDGIEQHAQHAAPLPRSEGTIGHWLRPATSSGTRIALYESDFTGAPTPDYNGFGSAGEALEIHTGFFDGDWYAVWQDGGVDDRREVRGGTVSVGEWSHVAVTWRVPGELKLYVNCTEVASVAMDAAFAGRTPTEHFIGKPSQFAGRHWPGDIDEIKVWDREFTADGVRSHFCPSIEPETTTVVAETPTLSARFGNAAAMSGEWLLVGSPGIATADWYRRDGAAGLQFHSSTSADFTETLGSLLETPKPLDVAGNLSAITDGDAVNVFELDPGAPASWNPITTLVDPAAENFGYALAVSGDRIAVGAPAIDGGTVYVFERDQGGPGAWQPTFANTPSGPGSNALYGRFLDLDGDLLAVYRQRSSLGGSSDFVDLYRRSESGGIPGWAPEASFSAESDSIVSIAVRGDRIAAGIIDPSGDERGSVVVRSRNQGGPDQWGIEQVFTASDADVVDRLGANVAWLDDRRLAAAAIGNRRDHQAIYLFRLGGLAQPDQELLLAQRTFDPITSIGASLGASLTGSSGLVVAGAPFSGFNFAIPPTLPGAAGRLHLFVPPLIFSDGFESATP